jgi:dTMP kinase
MFITLEGSEGSGKSTQIHPLADRLKSAGFNVLTTREPGGTEIGDQIREILFSMENLNMGARTETLLFQAARAQLVDQVIYPHLEKGGIVISDRYADSTLAYQGYGRGVDLAQLRSLLAFTTNKLIPDLTLLLDLDVEEGLKRRIKGGEINRLDACELEFYHRVRKGYRELVELEPHRWVVIKADLPEQEVSAKIWEVVSSRLKERT